MYVKAVSTQNNVDSSSSLENSLGTSLVCQLRADVILSICRAIKTSDGSILSTHTISLKVREAQETGIMRLNYLPARRNSIPDEGKYEGRVDRDLKQTETPESMHLAQKCSWFACIMAIVRN